MDRLAKYTSIILAAVLLLFTQAAAYANNTSFQSPTSHRSKISASGPCLTDSGQSLLPLVPPGDQFAWLLIINFQSYQSRANRVEGCYVFSERRPGVSPVSSAGESESETQTRSIVCSISSNSQSGLRVTNDGNIGVRLPPASQIICPSPSSVLGGRFAEIQSVSNASNLTLFSTLRLAPGNTRNPTKRFLLNHRNATISYRFINASPARLEIQASGREARTNAVWMITRTQSVEYPDTKLIDLNYFGVPSSKMLNPASSVIPDLNSSFVEFNASSPEDYKFDNRLPIVLGPFGGDEIYQIIVDPPGSNDHK